MGPAFEDVGVLVGALVGVLVGVLVGLDVGREEVPDGEEIAPDEDVPAAPVVPDGTTEPGGISCTRSKAGGCLAGAGGRAGALNSAARGRKSRAGRTTGISA